jgi:hypothetical protein
MKSKINLKNVVKGGIKLLFIISFFSFLNVKNISRNIHLAGLVVDASTLEPVKSANIYSADNKLLCKTNRDGYYNVNFEVNGDGQIEFALRIEKDKYKTYLDKERWGELKGDLKFIVYFGISKLNSDASTFSRFSNNKIESGNLSYENLKNGLESIKTEKEFDDQLSELKNLMINYQN